MTNADISPRQLLARLLPACVIVLLLAQALMGALSLSALDRLAAENAASRIELVLRHEAAPVQAGLNLGKPLAQYFGLDDLLHALERQLADLTGASVVLEDGRVLAQWGSAPDPALAGALSGRSGAAIQNVQVSDAGIVHELGSRHVRLALPLAEPDGGQRGALVVEASLQNQAREGLLTGNAQVLLATTAAAVLALVLLLGLPRTAQVFARSDALRKALPVLVLLAAQFVYAGYTIHTFRGVWLDVSRENVAQLAHGVQRDLDRVLSYGVSLNTVSGMDRYLSRILHGVPLIASLQVADEHGRGLARAGTPGTQALPLLQLPLGAQEQAPAQGMLAVYLDEGQLRQGLMHRLQDAVTVAIIAVIAALELLRLLDLVVARGRVTQREGEARPMPSPQLARPLMFGFLFAWALPLGFLPVYARGLIAPQTAPALVPVLMALPIVVEMACGLFMSLLAGHLSDRKGWRWPVLAGLVLSIAGSVACAAASDLTVFTLARGVVGVGYGLAWMGLQAFVVLATHSASRAGGMTNVIAGVFAGYLSGAAVGAMLMQQLGAQMVFYTASLLFCLPMLGVVLMMRGFSARPPAAAAESTDRPPAVHAQPSRPARPSGLRSLLVSRDFGLLLLASVIPFSIAQVGLLNYALPLLMESAGAHTASVGRVLMLYGLCIIYLGPVMGRRVDRSPHKKAWIVAAGLSGSIGLLAAGLFEGIGATIFGVLCLALAGCLAGGAQIAYMLALDRVQGFGLVGSTSLMRGADKLGQMLGPLLVAALFALASLSAGLVATAVLYLLATLVFMLAAPRDADHPDSIGVALR